MRDEDKYRLTVLRKFLCGYGLGVAIVRPG